MRRPARRARRRAVVAVGLVTLGLALWTSLTWVATFTPIRDAQAGPFERPRLGAELGPQLSAAVREASWPMFGASPTRARFVPSGLRPPFRVLYRIRGRGLIEMPPVVADGRVVFGTHEGRVVASRVEDGAQVWETNLDHCIASSPAVRDDVVYVGWSGPAPCRHGKDERGGVVALSLDTGEILWRFATGNVESSPAIVGDLLFFSAFYDRGSSTVYAMKLGKRRHIAWRQEVPSKLASSPALLGRRLYIAAYDRTLYSFDGWTGRLRWETSAFADDAGARFLLGIRSLVRQRSWSEGGYYATPAIAYGRAYVGAIEGVFSAFDALDGAHYWSRRLDGSIYGSAAVWQEKVYVGTTDGSFYALSAADGRVLWERDLGGRIFGSPTVTASRVYIATTSRETYVLDARTGEIEWQFADGYYSPLVVAGSRGFIVGKGSVYAVESACNPSCSRG